MLARIFKETPHIPKKEAARAKHRGGKAKHRGGKAKYMEKSVFKMAIVRKLLKLLSSIYFATILDPTLHWILGEKQEHFARSQYEMFQQ